MIIISTILFIIVVVISSYALFQHNTGGEVNNDNSLSDQIILFYGDGCPHCIIVDDYIAENDIENKISFLHKEVYNDSQNASELRQKAQLCNIPTSSIGVPFLWDGSTCIVGHEDIINFFKDKTNE